MSGAAAAPQTVRNSEHGPQFVRSLSAYHSDGKYADVKLVCEGGGAGEGVFWCHSLVLSSVSPFLSRLLVQLLNEDAVVTIYLPEIRAVHLAPVLDYIYTGVMFLCANQLAQVLRYVASRDKPSLSCQAQDPLSQSFIRSQKFKEGHLRTDF